MLYCENCKRVCATENDCICGSGELREPKARDFCYLTEQNEMFACILEASLVDKGIECVLIPMGDGYRSALGLSLGKFIICVPYESYAEAQDTVDYFYQGLQDDLRNDLVEHRADWHIAHKRVEKKLRKKLGLRDGDFFDCVHEVLGNAESITDDGAISSCEQGGHYISVRVGGVTFWFNSVTYEIFI